MPTYAAELKSTKVGLVSAHLQGAHDGALMTEGAHAIDTHLGKPNDEFYGKTQALTVAFNGEMLIIYAHHAARENNTIKYHRHPVNADIPRISFEHFQTACKHLMNAQAIGYKWVTERKDTLDDNGGGDDA